MDAAGTDRERGGYALEPLAPAVPSGRYFDVVKRQSTFRRDIVVRAFLAPLMVVWQVLCCCTFVPCARSSDAESSGALDAEAVATCHQPKSGAPTGDPDPGCHEDGGGACHDDGTGGCGCPKSDATIADAGSVAPVNAPVQLAWVPIDVPVAKHHNSLQLESWRRVEHPPPDRLLRIRVLRI